MHVEISSLQRGLLRDKQYKLRFYVFFKKISLSAKIVYRAYIDIRVEDKIWPSKFPDKTTIEHQIKKMQVMYFFLNDRYLR